MRALRYCTVLSFQASRLGAISVPIFWKLASEFGYFLYTRELLSYDKCFVYRGATASRVLRKVKLSSSVRWLTDFCTLTSLGRRRVSVRASRNLWDV